MNLPSLDTVTFDFTARAKAKVALAAQGLPTRKTEYWRYTPLARIWHDKKMDLLTQGGKIDRAAELKGTRIICVNGQVITPDMLPTGVSITRWQDTDTKQRDVLNHDIDYQRHILAATNQALASDGVLITVADDTVLKQPLILEHHVTEPGMMNLRHHLHIGKNAEVSIIEWPNICHDGIANILTSITNSPNSHYEHYLLSPQYSKGSYISAVHCDQRQDSRVTHFCDSRHHALLRLDVHAHLNEQGAHCTTNGAYYLTQNQHADHHLLVEHHASHTASMQNYKGIIDDRAHGIFNGAAIAHKGTQQIEAHQHNHNLLLSAQAEIDTKPELEIYTDAVTCTHGATVGQLDEQQLFYCQSRGIDPTTARQLLTDAFTQDIINTVDNKEVRTWLTQA